jgi:hypothetical protein
MIERFKGHIALCRKELEEKLRKRYGKATNAANEQLTNRQGLVVLEGSLNATLLDREANRSLTIDTMCQNLFDPIRAFEREWVFE